MDIINGDTDPESCLLSQTDSTSAVGWLRKSNFTDDYNAAAQLTTARKLAQLVIDNDCCLYSQWFQGDFNTVSDCLSQDFHLNDHSLTLLIKSCVPHQVPFGFEIYPLPPEISSWLTCLLQNQLFKEVWCKEPTRSKLSLGEDINYIYNPLEYQTILISKTSPKDNAIESLVHSLPPLDKVDFLLQGLLRSKVTRSEPPWTALHRPTNWLTSQTQNWTQTATLHSFYNANYAATTL